MAILLLLLLLFFVVRISAGSLSCRLAVTHHVFDRLHSNKVVACCKIPDLNAWNTYKIYSGISEVDATVGDDAFSFFCTCSTSLLFALDFIVALAGKFFSLFRSCCEVSVPFDIFSLEVLSLFIEVSDFVLIG